MSEDVLVEAVLAFGDVRRGDKILISAERAEALQRYLKPIGNVESTPDVGVVAPAELGEPTLTFFELEEQAANDQGGHLPAED